MVFIHNKILIKIRCFTILLIFAIRVQSYAKKYEVAKNQGDNVSSCLIFYDISFIWY